MKKLMMTATVAALGVAACGGESEPTEKTSAAISASLEGTYDFLLEQSDVAAPLREKCAADAKCWNEIREEADKEKIRFTRDTSGQLVFSSYGIEDGKEHLFLEAPVAIAEASPNVYRGRLVGWPKGKLVAQLTRARSEMKIERRADGTITVIDEKKGRLVYKRAS